MDRHLNWKEHILELKTRARRALNLIKIVASQSWGANRSTLFKLYWAIARSKLDYASQIYNTGSDNTTKMLDSIHNDAIRSKRTTSETS